MYKVYQTLEFKKLYSKLPLAEQRMVDNIIRRLAENPNQGKCLGVHNIREKKIGGRRVYYIVYESYLIVLMVAISDKKTQQGTIELIRDLLPEYMNLVKEMSNKP
jgi:putative component of toxin-antitoxin plasmid stabilization module